MRLINSFSVWDLGAISSVVDTRLRKSETSNHCPILPEMVRAIEHSMYISPRLSTSPNIVSIVSRHEQVNSCEWKQRSVSVPNSTLVRFPTPGNALENAQARRVGAALLTSQWPIISTRLLAYFREARNSWARCRSILDIALCPVEAPGKFDASVIATRSYHATLGKLASRDLRWWQQVAEDDRRCGQLFQRRYSSRNLMRLRHTGDRKNHHVWSRRRLGWIRLGWTELGLGWGMRCAALVAFKSVSYWKWLKMA